MNGQLRAVLDSTLGKASDMTHSLSTYGGGSMGQGVCRLWANGYWRGAASTGSVFVVLGLAGWIVARPYRAAKREAEYQKAYEEGRKAAQGEEGSAICSRQE